MTRPDPRRGSLPTARSTRPRPSALAAVTTAVARAGLTATAVVAAAAAGGCMFHKTVTINTDPAGAALAVTRVHNGQPVGPVPLPVASTQSPARIDLDFPDDGTAYEVTASKTYYRPDKVTVGKEPAAQVEYMVPPLHQYQQPTDALEFGPTPGPGVRRLVPLTKPALAYLGDDANEPPTNQYVAQPVQVDLNEPPGVEVDYPSLATAQVSADLLVFQRSERLPGGGWSSKIYTVSTRGGRPVQLTQSTAQQFTPTVSRSGDAIVFSSDNTSDNPTLWRTRVGGGSLLTALTRADSVDYLPSAGEQLLAYTSVPPRATGPQVWVSRPDGSQPSYVTEGWDPQVSPRGDYILYLQADRRTGHAQLWRVNRDGSSPTQLTNNTTYDVACPRWKPDDQQWIAYSSDEGTDDEGRHNFDIWLIRADNSGDKIRLTYNGSYDGSPAWDRTGRKIYFRSNRGGQWHIWSATILARAVVGGTGAE